MLAVVIAEIDPWLDIAAPGVALAISGITLFAAVIAALRTKVH